MTDDMNKALENMKTTTGEDIGIVMNRAAEALDLLAQYGTDFSRECDRDETASILKIISDYLFFQAESIAD